jgi:hypothetical protein
VPAAAIRTSSPQRSAALSGLKVAVAAVLQAFMPIDPVLANHNPSPLDSLRNRTQEADGPISVHLHEIT